MKKVKIGFIALAVITLSFITTGHLYTKEKVAELGANIGVYSFDMALYSENPQDGVMGLASLLTSNMGILGEEFISYENNKRENKWRDLIASNPSLAYSAFDMYSTTFIENYQTSFEEYKNSMITSFKENPSEYSDRMLLKANSLNSKNALKKSVENRNTDISSRRANNAKVVNTLGGGTKVDKLDEEGKQMLVKSGRANVTNAAPKQMKKTPMKQMSKLKKKSC
jgi:hypothetical protein